MAVCHSRVAHRWRDSRRYAEEVCRRGMPKTYAELSCQDGSPGHAAKPTHPGRHKTPGFTRNVFHRGWAGFSP